MASILEPIKSRGPHAARGFGSLGLYHGNPLLQKTFNLT